MTHLKDGSYWFITKQCPLAESHWLILYRLGFCTFQGRLLVFFVAMWWE